MSRPDWLWHREWRRFDSATGLLANWSTWFNLVEAVCWFVLAVLVLRRFVMFRRSAWEPVYAATFVLFGLTDIYEAWRLTSWLLWVKALVCAALLIQRRWLHVQYYPGWKTY
jgi:hypothetical protein